MAELFQALVVAQLVDDATGAAVAAPIRVSADLPGLRSRVAGSGFAGLVGDPDRVLPAARVDRLPADRRWPSRPTATRPRHEPVTFTQQHRLPGELRRRGARRAAAASVRRPWCRSHATTSTLANRPRPLAGATVDVIRLVVERRRDLRLAPPRRRRCSGVGPGLSVARPTAHLDVPALTAPAEPPRSLPVGRPPGAASGLR